jgi:hypothetical protein
MIIADVGDIPKVTGKRSAIPPTGPIPGSTPIRVPKRTPKKQDRRLAGWRATEKPLRRLLKISNIFSP